MFHKAITAAPRIVREPILGALAVGIIALILHPFGLGIIFLKIVLGIVACVVAMGLFFLLVLINDYRWYKRNAGQAAFDQMLERNSQ